MKTCKKTLILASLFSFAFLLHSCDKEDDAQAAVDFSAEDAALAAKADTAIEGTLTIMENAYDENEEATRGQNSISLFPGCTTITINPNGDGTGTVILDFGTGCTLNNGATVSGKINLAYEAIVNDSRILNYTFDNYFYNGNGVAGGGEILREFSNANGFPASTVNETITVSFPNSTTTATRNGLRIAEWVEGVGSGTWTDNVYHITGNWDTTFTNGFERSGLVTETLVRRLNCPYLVSGILEVTQDGLTGSLDFGDGECDAQAIFTFNGVDYTVFL
tara:strand:+ start:53559 stop:54389 length:831 start_codon:yes stop_codon:yes gene_type:complete